MMMATTATTAPTIPHGGLDVPDLVNEDCNPPIRLVPDFLPDHLRPEDLLWVLPDLLPPEDLLYVLPDLLLPEDLL